MNPQELMKEFLAARTGIEVTPGLRCIGRAKNGALVAVVGFNNYTGTAMEVHVAAAGSYWGNRALLRAAFDYPFNVCNCKLLFCSIPSGNTAALKLGKHLGFETQTVIEDAHPDGALHIMVMRRENCRWLQKESNYGKE